MYANTMAIPASIRGNICLIPIFFIFLTPPKLKHYSALLICEAILAAILTAFSKAEVLTIPFPAMS